MGQMVGRSDLDEPSLVAWALRLGGAFLGGQMESASAPSPKSPRLSRCSVQVLVGTLTGRLFDTDDGALLDQTERFFGAENGSATGL